MKRSIISLLRKTYHKQSIAIILLSAFFACVVFGWIFVYRFVEGIYQSATQRITNKDEFIVSAKQSQVIGISFKDKTNIDDNIITKLKNSELIRTGFVLYNVNIPSSVSFSFGEINFATDIFLFAIEDQYYPYFNKSSGIWISQQLVDFYNAYISPYNNQLPKVSNLILHSLPIQLDIGKSSFFSFDKTVSIQKNISNISNHYPFLSIVIPYSEINPVLSQIGGSLSAHSVIGIKQQWVSFDKIQQEIGPEYDLQYQEKQAQKTNQDLKRIVYIIWLSGGVILLVILSFIAYIAYQQRQQNKGFFQTLISYGITKADVVIIFCSKLFIEISIGIIVASLGSAIVTI